MRKAIEVEYWVIDRDGKLTAPGELTELSEYVEEEFVSPLIELKTPPCDTYEELESTFLEQLDELVALAEERDKQLVPLGTPLDCPTIDRLPDDRGEIQRRIIGRKFRYAKYCAGTHFHFEKENVTDQLNVLLALDPALALLNSSPYYDGTPIASSARSYLYRRKCYEDFPKHGQLWKYASSVGEWQRRLEDCFGEFKAAAVANDIEIHEIESNFTSDDIVWTPVRLRDTMPTVEWRSPDTTLPSEILRLAKQMNSIMESISDRVVRIDDEGWGMDDDTITLPPFETLENYSKAAIHDGLDSQILTSYLEQFGFDVESYSPLTATFDGNSELSGRDASRLRCEYATQLKHDLNRTTPALPA